MLISQSLTPLSNAPPTSALRLGKSFYVVCLFEKMVALLASLLLGAMIFSPSLFLKFLQLEANPWNPSVDINELLPFQMTDDH